MMNARTSERIAKVNIQIANQLERNIAAQELLHSLTHALSTLDHVDLSTPVDDLLSRMMSAIRLDPVV